MTWVYAKYLQREHTQCQIHQNEAASRAWIDAFFFRASTMVPQGKQLVLSLEHSILGVLVKPSSFITVGGYIDYAVISANASISGKFLQWFYFYSSFSADFTHLDKLLNTDHTLFVAEAKTRTLPLRGHVPQALGEMYACAKRLESVGCLWYYFPILNDNAAAEEKLFVEL